jgi:hypothetical protein
MEEKRMVTINGVEFTTTAEVQITGSLIRQLCGAAKEDHVLASSASGTPYPLADEAVLPPDAEHVVIVPAFAKDCE